MTTSTPKLDAIAAELAAKKPRSKPVKPVPLTEQPLKIFTAAQLVAQLATETPPVFLASPIWPSDAYGVIGAKQKAGKTWLIMDLAVNVASGGAWLGTYPCERPGPVLVFLGEGGKRKMTRRFMGVAEHYALEFDKLPIHVCLRAPHLSDKARLAQVEERIAEIKPVLVVIDPLYLAARGSDGSQLYGMGAALEGIQSICQDNGAALVICHHFNRKDAGGSDQFSGAGPAEWGRVLIMVTEKAGCTNPTTKEETVTLELDFEGDEIPDLKVSIQRKIRSVIPGDLASPIEYSVKVLPGVIPEVEGDGLSLPQRRILALLTRHPDWLTKAAINEFLPDDDEVIPHFKDETIARLCKELVGLDLAEFKCQGNGYPSYWRAKIAPGGGPASSASSAGAHYSPV